MIIFPLPDCLTACIHKFYVLMDYGCINVYVHVLACVCRYWYGTWNHDYTYACLYNCPTQTCRGVKPHMWLALEYLITWWNLITHKLYTSQWRLFCMRKYRSFLLVQWNKNYFEGRNCDVLLVKCAFNQETPRRAKRKNTHDTTCISAQDLSSQECFMHLSLVTSYCDLKIRVRFVRFCKGGRNHVWW